VSLHEQAVTGRDGKPLTETDPNDPERTVQMRRLAMTAAEIDERVRLNVANTATAIAARAAAGRSALGNGHPHI